MTYFDQTRSKKSAIKEGETDVLDIVDERKAEAAKLTQMREQSELEDTAALRSLICIGRYVDGPGMMTIEEHKDALDAIDATLEEREEYDYRVLQEENRQNRIKRSLSVLDDWFDDNISLASRSTYNPAHWPVPQVDIHTR